VGEFEIENIILDTPHNVWQQTWLFSGVKFSFYNDYFQGKDYAIAIKVGKIKVYNSPIDPVDMFDKFTPPQSFMYFNKEIEI